MDGISSTSGPAPIKESVSPDVKERYDQLLEQIQKILSKKPPFDVPDSKQLERLLTELKGMHDQGLTGSMDQFLDVLFAFAEAAGANPSQNNFYLTPNQIEAMSKATLTIAVDEKGSLVNKSVTLPEALAIIMNPDYDPKATQKLGDMLLAFSSWGYDMYTSELKKLKEQIDIATAAINNLQALQEILNMIKTKYPDNYNFPPTTWDEIPKEIQDKLRSAIPNTGGLFWNGDGTPKDMSIITNWAKNNPGTYADWSDAFFKREIGIEPNPQPDANAALARLLSARDQLKKQLDALEKAGGKDLDKSEGSPYATIKKVLDEVDKQISPNAFPYTNPPTDWDAFVKSRQIDPNWINNFIKEGNKNNNPLADGIDKAIQSNQNLSSKMSDEIKAKNLTLQTFFDILNQVSDALSKILTGTAQKVNR